MVINEIMYDLPGADSGREWIEILNISDSEIDLTGWKFNDGSNHTLNEPPKNGGQGSFRISTGEYAILAGDATTFLIDHPGFSGTVIDTVMALKNTSATLKIFDPESNEIDSITYESTWGADGNGKTLEKIIPQDPSIKNNWQESAPDGGTPGAFNSSAQETPREEEPPRGEEPATEDSTPTTTVNRPPVAEAGSDIATLVNREIFFDASQSYDPDNDSLIYFWNFGDGATDTKKQAGHIYLYPGQYIVSLLIDDGEFSDLDIITVNIYSPSVIISEFMPNPIGKDKSNEWIELFNQSEQIANLTNWQLGSQAKNNSLFVFPANSFIAPKQFLVIQQSISQIALNNNADQICLFYPNGSLAAEISYQGEAKEGLAVAFDGQDYFWTSAPTPGAANIISLISPKEECGNFSADNFQATAQEKQEKPEILAQTDLDQSQTFLSLNQPSRAETPQLAQPAGESAFQFASQQAAALGQTSQSIQKANLILILSIIISGSLLISWLLIRLKKKLSH